MKYELNRHAIYSILSKGACKIWPKRGMKSYVLVVLMTGEATGLYELNIF